MLHVSRSVVSNPLRPHELYVAHQAPLSMRFSRQEYWSGLPFPTPGIFVTQGGKTKLPDSRAATLQIFFPNLLVFFFNLAYGVFLQCRCFLFLFLLYVVKYIHLFSYDFWASLVHFEIKTIFIFSTNTL